MRNEVISYRVLVHHTGCTERDYDEKFSLFRADCSLSDGIDVHLLNAYKLFSVYSGTSFTHAGLDEAMVLNTQLQLKWPNHSSHLLTGLKSLFKNEQLVDCTLKCNKHSLKVHRSVLAACSPYFEVIFVLQFDVL